MARSVKRKCPPRLRWALGSFVSESLSASRHDVGRPAPQRDATRATGLGRGEAHVRGAVYPASRNGVKDLGLGAWLGRGLGSAAMLPSSRRPRPDTTPEVT